MSEITTTAAIAVKETKRRSFLMETTVRLAREKPLATFGGVIVLLMFLAGIFAGSAALCRRRRQGEHADPGPLRLKRPGFGGRFQGPSSTTGSVPTTLGRDLLSRIIYGAQVSMIVGLVGARIQTIMNLLHRRSRGLSRRQGRHRVQRFVDVVMCFPAWSSC